MSKRFFYLCVVMLLPLIPRMAQAQDYVFLAQWSTAHAYRIRTMVSGDVATINPSGLVTTYTSSGAILNQWQTSLPTMAYGIAVDDSNNVYIANWGTHQVDTYSELGVYRFSFAHPLLFNIWDVTVDGQHNVYVISNQNKVVVFDAAGGFLDSWQPIGLFNSPWSIVADDNGYIYVVDAFYQTLTKFASDGEVLDNWANPGALFSTALDVDNIGNVYIGDGYGRTIRVFTNNGTMTSEWGHNGNGNGGFNEFYGLCVDDMGYVYVADVLNELIQKFGLLATQTETTSWGRLKSMYRSASKP